jgi:hypothetical protein
MAHGAWAHRTIVQMSLLGHCPGGAVNNVLHFEAEGAAEATYLTDALAQADALALANQWNTGLKASWLAMHPSPYVLDTIRVQVLERPSAINHRLVAQDVTAGQAGTGGDQADGSGSTVASVVDDYSTSVVIKWAAAIAGRSHRGRTYVGPLASVWKSAGRIVTGFGTGKITPFITAMLAAYTGTGAVTNHFNLVAYSRPYNTGQYEYTKRVGGALQVITPPDYDGNSTFIASGSYDPILREQRRREIGVGS